MEKEMEKNEIQKEEYKIKVWRGRVMQNKKEKGTGTEKKKKMEKAWRRQGEGEGKGKKKELKQEREKEKGTCLPKQPFVQQWHCEE